MNIMGKIKLVAVVLILLFAAACAKKRIPEPLVVEPEAPKATSASEGSLWPGENSSNNLFSDNKATNVGDIVTVHLVEKTTASNKANTSTSRSQENTFAFSTGADPTEFSFGGGQKFGGLGSTSRSESLVSTITAMIIEVLPNGTMKIDGMRKLKINDAEQFVRVTGIIRRQDINFDNSILSTKIANAEIAYDGVGALDGTQRSGFMGRMFNKIWPF